MTGQALTRLADWHPRLVAYLAGVRATPFAYGQHDCALFAAGAVAAMTGVDLAASWRGRYSSLKAGLKLVGRDGAADHVAVARAHLEPVHPAFAAVGDLAVILEADVPAFGIFEGQHIFVLRETGLGLVPREAATLAFKVP